MRPWTRYMLMPVLLAQALSSCSLIDEPTSDDYGSVDVSLAFTVSKANAAATTRMSDDVVQEQPASGNHVYRGLDVVAMIPFVISGDDEEVTVTDRPLRLIEGYALKDTFEIKSSPIYGGFYLYDAYTMIRGINSFLVYGKAPERVYSKAQRGSLLTPSESEFANPDLNTLRFKPEPILSVTDPPDEATLLAGYLNHIAQAITGDVSWSNTTDQTLKGYFMNFTGQENEGNMVMAGASVNIVNHVNALYDAIYPLNFEAGSEGANLRADIIDRIKNYTTLTLTDNGKVDADWKLTGFVHGGNAVSYPSSLGLPDGAAALQWQNGDFKPQTQTTTLASINSISRYCYPPELYYVANSRIDTSNDAIAESSYHSGTDWSSVLSQYENKNSLVTGNTQAVAIQKPLQYAVGRLKMSMQANLPPGITSLKDGAEKDIPLYNTAESKNSFPLTGVIICNQHPVDFNFKPVLEAGAASHADDRFIYDSEVGSGRYLTTEEVAISSTLVLQSYDRGEGSDHNEAEEVIIALEFRNDSGQKFVGKDGIIYPGTKFYLLGKIKPNEGVDASTAEQAKGRVFTQDYITSVSTKVESLANAYNVLPDLLGGRLELCIKLTPKWIQAKTTNVVLE